MVGKSEQTEEELDRSVPLLPCNLGNGLLDQRWIIIREAVASSASVLRDLQMRPVPCRLLAPGTVKIIPHWRKLLLLVCLKQFPGCAETQVQSMVYRLAVRIIPMHGSYDLC
jgi:hypothetical protein